MVDNEFSCKRTTASILVVNEFERTCKQAYTTGFKRHKRKNGTITSRQTDNREF